MLNLHNLSRRTATMYIVASAYAATQDSNQWHDCHAGQPQPRSPKAASHRWRQGVANIRSGGLLSGVLRRHDPKSCHQV